MRISRYTMNFQSQKLDGVLIEDEGAYSQIQPWPSLGDMRLEAYLQDLPHGTMPLTRRALQILEIEKNAKRKDESLVPLPIPPSHLLISTDTPAKEILADFRGGVEIFKFKVGNDPERELKYLRGLKPLLHEHPIRLRIDVNLKFAREAAFAFFSQLDEKTLSGIDYVEDPIRGDERDWEKFSETFDLRCAHDFAHHDFRAVADAWVLKPSREDPWVYVKQASEQMKRIVVTSALDHPLGYVVAAWEAHRIQVAHPLLIDTCGLISFAHAPFSRHGAYPNFSALDGRGFGMDKYLKSLHWETYESTASP